MQGRFKRDGSAAGKSELRGETDRGSAPERADESDTTAAASYSDAQDAPSGVAPDAGGNGKAGATGKGSSARSTGSRRSLNNLRISTRLVSLLALPVIAATTLGALRIDASLADAEQLDNIQLLTEMTEHATELAAALQEERDKSAGPLISTGNEKDEAVVSTREQTNRARKAFNEATSEIDPDDEVMAGVQSTVTDIIRQLNGIKSIREDAYENPKYISQTVDRYSRLIDSLLSLSLDMAQATSNSEMIQSTRALAAFSSAKEYASIQRAIISAGLARDGGPKLSENDRLYAKSAMNAEKSNLQSFGAIYGDNAGELLEPLDGGVASITAANTYRKRVLTSKGGIKREQRSYLDWYDQQSTKIQTMERIEDTLLSHMEQQARKLHEQAQRETLINGAVVVLVLGISLVGAFVVARSMVRSLRRLQDTAQDVARKRLPELVQQMSEAEPQDVDTSVESVGVHSRDEIGKVAAAFDDVHREAVRLAGEQALLRGNVNAMFTNLSRRSQGLVQRQLSLISELESREADPDQLSSLFKLDHLATRMRRNGENLLVLAGEEPGRRWTRPVPLVDVLRAAASEVEQYERIELNAVPTTEVAGRVVNDLVHLLAELLENATSFSSPQTKVKVTGHALPDGRVLVEIHDTGIGLSPEDLSSINERLANPPTVDVSVSRRMGLFVVGRLSLRHGIRVQLRPSDSGGTTALVMLPVDIAQGAQAAKGRPGSGGAVGASSPKSGGLAAALQREPRGGVGPGAGAGASQPAGTNPSPDQVGNTQPTPILPTAQGDGTSGTGGGGAGGGDTGGSGAGTSGGLPVRPTAGSGAGSGGAPAGGGTPTNFFGDSGHPSGGGAGLPQRRGPLPRRGAPGEPPAQGGPDGNGGVTGGDPSDTGEFPAPQSGGPGDTGEIPLPPPAGPGDTGQFTRPDVSAPPASGPAGPGAQAGADERGPTSWPTAEDAPLGHHDPETSGEFARPGHPQDLEAGPGDTSQFPGPTPAPPAPYDDPGFGIPSGPPAADDARTPIFESMESNWFHDASGPGERTEEPPEPAAPAADFALDPSRQSEAYVPPTGPATDGGQVPWQQQHAPDPSQNGGMAGTSDTGAHWGASPNDERWRQAEQVRQPAAGGVTTSGLPRRVPRANLVAGTAQQQDETQSGPQVSRSPDDVRGRLTNLRRGIQQGRQAGTDSHGTGPSYQQER